MFVYLFSMSQVRTETLRPYLYEWKTKTVITENCQTGTFLAAKFWMTAVKFSSRRISRSTLMTVQWTSLLCVMDVRNLFSIVFNLEKERSPVQLEIIKTRHIRNVVSTLEKYRPPLFSFLTDTRTFPNCIRCLDAHFEILQQTRQTEQYSNTWLIRLYTSFS